MPADGRQPGSDPTADRIPRAAVRVMAASLLARAPQGMAPLSLVLLTQERTGSLAAAGAASGAWGLGIAVGQPLWARPAGRGRAGAVVARVAVAQAVVLGALALVPWDSPWPGIAAAGLAGLLGAPVTSVARSLWPDLATGPRALDRLFTVDATAQEVIWIAGPALVGGLVFMSGPAAAALATALAGGLGAWWFARTLAPLWRTHPAVHGSERFLGRLLVPWLALSVMAVGLGLTEVAVPAVALLEGHRSLAGPLLAGWSLGSMAGGLAAARRPSAAEPAARVTWLLLLLAGSSLLTTATWTAGLGWFALVLFVSGLALAPTLASVYNVVSRTAPASRRTEAFAVGSTFVLTGLATGTALGGALSERSPTDAFLAATAAYASAAAGWWAWRQRTRSTRPSSQTGSPAS